MKIEITNGSMIFKFLMYSVTVPKENNEIQYHLYDPSEIVVSGVVLFIEPQIYKTSFIGNFLMFLKWCTGYKYGGMRVALTNQTIGYIRSGRGIFSAELQELKNAFVARSLNIEGKDNIANFLNDLKNHGWDIEQPQQIFNQWLNRPIDPKFIPGTPERKNDRKVLMIIIFIFFEIMYSAAFFLGSKNIIKDIPIYLLITGIMAGFCLVFYLLIRKK